MAFRFRKRISFGKGLGINISKKGFSSVSLGRAGLSLNVGKRGSRSTFGIPGTGLSYSAYSPHRSAGRRAARSVNQESNDQLASRQELETFQSLASAAKIENQETVLLALERDLIDPLIKAPVLKLSKFNKISLRKAILNQVEGQIQIFNLKVYNPYLISRAKEAKNAVTHKLEGQSEFYENQFVLRDSDASDAVTLVNVGDVELTDEEVANARKRNLFGLLKSAFVLIVLGCTLKFSFALLPSFLSTFIALGLWYKAWGVFRNFRFHLRGMGTAAAQADACTL